MKLFPEGKEALALKAAEKASKSNPSSKIKVSSASSHTLQASSNQKSSTNVASLFSPRSLSPQALAKQLQPNAESFRKIQSYAKSTPGKNIFALVGITSEGDVCLQLKLSRREKGMLKMKLMG